MSDEKRADISCACCFKPIPFSTTVLGQFCEECGDAFAI